jgi:hypothetical protein
MMGSGGPGGGEPGGGLAVIGRKDGDDANVVRGHLRTADASGDLSGAIWFAPRDLDDLQRAVREGTVRRVVFARLDYLLVGIWDEDIDPDELRRAAVEFAGQEDEDSPALVWHVLDRWCGWNRRRRRRQTAAGVVLIALVLAAVFLTSWLTA